MAREESLRVLAAMGQAVTHRGPDAEGIWLADDLACGLVHRRLAIIDLSANGAQPMTSLSGRFVLAYNGEIYNHSELRRRLECQGKAPAWRGHSDTETLLAAIEAWGLADALRASVGMFALALWDRLDRRLQLARDRFGEKPLYFGQQRGVLLFGSDLGSLRRHPSFRADLDPTAIAEFTRLGYVPAPLSIYRGIGKVGAGEIVAVGSDQRISRERYWLIDDVRNTEQLPANPVAALDNVLRQAVIDQMIADVPLGAFLSGGVDSSLIVALMQATSHRPVKTFTIGFSEESYDEAPYAKAVATHLGTDHTELYVTPADAMAVVPDLPSIYTEPFADVSQVPSCLLSRLARTAVSVSLSGDAGDELFGGYTRHVMAAGYGATLTRLPVAMRRMGAAAATALSPAAWDRLVKVLGIGGRFTRAGDAIHKAALVVASRDADDLYHRLVSRHEAPRALLSIESSPTYSTLAATGATDAERMMFSDLLGYLPDDVLVKVDRAAMYASLETRVPFLDHRVVGFAQNLPLEFKIRDGESKWILRQLLDRYVPRKLIDRPKAGFAVPMGEWLRGPLRDWAESLLEERRLREDGVFAAPVIRSLWTEHVSARRDRSAVLWNVLMFNAWASASHA